MSYKLAQEKILQLNTVKVNGSDGWPNHVRENKTVYVGYTCSGTLLIIWLKGGLLQLQLHLEIYIKQLVSKTFLVLSHIRTVNSSDIKKWQNTFKTILKTMRLGMTKKIIQKAR